MATETSLSEDEKSIRLFKSDFLEFFTHISPIIVLVVFLHSLVIWSGALPSKTQMLGGMC